MSLSPVFARKLSNPVTKNPIHRGQLGDGARIATRIVPADAPDLHTLLDDPAFQRRLVAGVSPLLCPPEDLESLAAAPGRSLPSRGRSLA